MSRDEMAALREALAEALDQWEMYADAERGPGPEDLSLLEGGRVEYLTWLRNGTDAEAEKYRRCLAALRTDPAPADPEERAPAAGLDVERLADAIVTAVRAERAPIGYKGDGWPAYWEKDRPATVLAVSSLAKRLAAEYARD